MKKCSRCGRLGLFFYIDADGFCEKCAVESKRQQEAERAMLLEKEREQQFADAQEFVRKISGAFEDIAKNGAKLPVSAVGSWVDTEKVPFDCVQRLREDCRMICSELPQWEEYLCFEDALLEMSIPDEKIRGCYNHPFIPFGFLNEKGWVVPNDFSKMVPELLKKVKALDGALLLYGEYEYKTYRIVGTSYDNEDGTNRRVILSRIKSKAKPFQDKTEITLVKYKYQDEDAIAVYANGLQVGHISRRDLASSVLPRWDRYDGVEDYELIGSAGLYGMDIVVRFEKEH